MVRVTLPGMDVYILIAIMIHIELRVKNENGSNDPGRCASAPGWLGGKENRHDTFGTPCAMR